MKILWEILTGSFTALYVLIVQWIQTVSVSGLSPSFTVLFLIILLTTLFFASGFLSATISEMKNRNRIVHFFLGLCVPYLYPLAIYFLLPENKKRSSEEEDEELFGDVEDDGGREKIRIKGKGKRKKVEQEPEEEPDVEATWVPKVPKAMNYRYFMAVFNRSKRFTACETYVITLTTGQQLISSAILDVNPEILVFETTDSKKRSRTMRLPYNKLADFEINRDETGEVGMDVSANSGTGTEIKKIVEEETKFMDAVTDDTDAGMDTAELVPAADEAEFTQKVDDSEFSGSLDETGSFTSGADVEDEDETGSIPVDDLDTTRKEEVVDDSSDATEKPKINLVKPPVDEVSVSPEETSENIREIKTYDQAYFASIAVDDEGNHRGPFILEMSDGRLLDARIIVSPLPDVLVLETVGDGGKIRTVRIPYDRIISCNDKSDWMGDS